MGVIKYNYNILHNYMLNKTNIYAYSFFATKILNKKVEPKIDLNSIISSISDSYNSVDVELINLRNENHSKYYNLDISFLNKVDDRYQDKANKIKKAYNSINSLSLLKDNKEKSIKNNNLINFIEECIAELKYEIRQDLLTIIDYIDQEEKDIDTRFLNDYNTEANVLRKKYEALILNKPIIDINNTNLEMKRQKDRLVNVRLLNQDIKNYINNKMMNPNSKYNFETVKILKENLSYMLSEYIFLLTHQEFHYVEEMCKNLINHDYDYIESFLPTYKILVDKIWRHSLSDIKQYNFDFYYLICDFNLNSDMTFALMNRDNMNEYPDTGYICSYKGNIVDVFGIDNDRLLDIKLPIQVTEKYVLNKDYTVDKNLILLEAAYTKNDNKELFDNRLPIIEIK